ncbi:hypothetical protein DWUX_1292 [Desulfovibrio diazotrophicus]|nr:hypothetical protein DWUX_1292 [Desulfovibrio diazotrophicus]
MKTPVFEDAPLLSPLTVEAAAALWARPSAARGANPAIHFVEVPPGARVWRHFPTFATGTP